MTLAITLVIVSVIALAVVLRLAVARNLQVSGRDNSAAQIQPIDVEAFRTLIRPAEDEYLRRRLPPAQFRMVRRERLRAMAAYVRVAGKNAAVLVRIGQAALASGDARTADAAKALVNDALLLRRNAALMLVRIHIALAWPNSGLAAAPVADSYEHLSGAAMLLGRLQNPSAAVRLSATR